MQYLFNDVSDSIQQWNVAAASGSLPITAGMYAIGRLYKNITTDESGNQVVQYTDKHNHVILKKVQALASPATAAHKGWAVHIMCMMTWAICDLRCNPAQ